VGVKSEIYYRTLCISGRTEAFALREQRYIIIYWRLFGFDGLAVAIDRSNAKIYYCNGGEDILSARIVCDLGAYPSPSLRPTHSHHPFIARTYLPAIHYYVIPSRNVRTIKRLNRFLWRRMRMIMRDNRRRSLRTKKINYSLSWVKSTLRF